MIGLAGVARRLADWWCSRRDARLDPEAMLAHVQARLALIGADGLGRVEREWLRYRQEVAGDLTRLAGARATHAATSATLAHAELDLRSEPTEEELARRVGGEDRTTTAVIRHRRLAEHRRRFTDATARTAALLAEQATAAADIARLRGEIQSRFEQAQARAGTIGAEVFARRTAYLSHPIRRHPRIVALVSAEFRERPEWMVAARSPDSGEA